MTEPFTLFPPSKAEAQARLAAFTPMAGRTYAQQRNFDAGPGQPTAVSLLSPYLRMRVLDEVDVTNAVLRRHSAAAADKFIAEVFWRSYWKGWMELRPSVWQGYQSDLKGLHNQIQTQSGLRANWQAACLGQTGIAPFDAWATELAQTGYLHNHARMWFASIWIFTLQLPWQLGADFFLRHLLDGDAAVNTLSWRWVAGIQTPGKTYLARADNIAKFTKGRFGAVHGLARQAPAVAAPPAPAPMPLPAQEPLSLDDPYGLLVHSDDIGGDWIDAPAPASLAYASADHLQSPWHMTPFVENFRRALAKDIAPKAVLPALRDVKALQGVGQGTGVKADRYPLCAGWTYSGLIERIQFSRRRS